jgi:leucyl/phenylalanyl-tRNA---protein transferase
LISFPHPLYADSDGILAIGGDLSTERLELAYSYGIFPWFDPDLLPLWWFPDPRMVLSPDELRISKSMRPYLNQRKFSYSLDRNFESVMRNCMTVPRSDQEGTWISEDIIRSFCRLHEKGMAHSVEVWDGDQLAGGLYGMAIGRIFYGESMFSHRSNASKFALLVLCRTLMLKGFTLIDCQQETDHLRRMGARPIRAVEFFRTVQDNLSNFGLHQHKWCEWERERESVYRR